jgi:hypothetical protein
MARLARATALIALAAGSALAATSAQAAPAQLPIQPLEFKGAELGMTLADWKAQPFPGRAQTAVSPICSDDPRAARLGMAITPAEKQAGVIGCTYVYGPADGDGPRHPVAMTDRLTADHVLYKFRDGRLASVRYLITVDAFDDVVARLDALTGTHATVQRDQVKAELGETLPRVRMNWKTTSGQVELSDPSNNPNRLSVTLSAAPAKAS